MNDSPRSVVNVLGALARLALSQRSLRASRPSNHARRPNADEDASGSLSDSDHLRAAALWLASAQDATHDGGVAAHYGIIRGWASSYPETTGYLVPTFLQLAEETGLESFEKRAAEAISFLLRCQLASGAFPAGRLRNSEAKPSVFNSAQIICGLVAWHRHTNDQTALDAAVRAAEWLVSVQHHDGSWTRYVHNGVAASYAAHASCWLAELGTLIGNVAFQDSARRHVEWVLGLVDSATGWFDKCGFTALCHERRTGNTHAIGYTLWGTYMTSQLLGISEGVTCVERAAREMTNVVERLGWLPGVLDAQWRPRAGYACVTGNVQMALLWLRLFEVDRDVRWSDAADATIELSKRAQTMGASTPWPRGGIPGSDPIWGSYAWLVYPNWGAKFFVDALIEKRRVLAFG